MILGFIGGNFSALAGSGVDICSFSVLTLLFRISEKVATPTSVVLMAINTCVGFYWRQLMTDGKNKLTINHYIISVNQKYDISGRLNSVIIIFRWCRAGSMGIYGCLRPYCRSLCPDGIPYCLILPSSRYYL